MTRFHVVVRGRVQGVGFRWFVREAARDFPGCIAVGIDARDGKVAIEGWAETRAISGSPAGFGTDPTALSKSQSRAMIIL